MLSRSFLTTRLIMDIQAMCTLHLIVASKHFQLTISRNTKRICTKEEVDDLIRHIKDENTEWIENENVRREEYGRIIKSGNRREIIKLINTMYLHRKKLSANKKRLRNSDESLFEIAENMIFEEFAYVLGIEREDVEKYIQEHTT